MDVRIFLLVFLLHLVQPKVLDLSCKQIRAFVDGHNSRRLSLAKGSVPNQPAASEMKYIIWDKELAGKAAKWASTNQFNHNPDRTIGSGRFTTGENIYMAFSTNLNWELDINSAIRSWFDEHKHYTYGPIKASDFNGSNKHQIGHYTQMAWSDSVYLGCGISENLKNGKKEYYVVCNYGPPGNYMGQKPYKSGNKSGKLMCSTKNCSRLYGDKC
ncbi:unnamed protein product [Euphydryas editha]|uniref:SCP domain-containing protein n=1 Tax=Euphydryas editha TaxID=104508 RepID=A0AAU9V1D3_EUPED|nr:unnamed protein product [Euphydryas editha]